MIKQLVAINLTLVIFFLFSCQSMRETIHLHCIEGIVIEKKKAEYQHGEMNVKFSNLCDSSFKYLVVYNNDEKFWNYLSVGDSLFKEKESCLIEVKKMTESEVFRLTDW